MKSLFQLAWQKLCRALASYGKRGREQYRFLSIPGPATVAFDFQKACNGLPQVLEESALETARQRYLPYAQACPVCHARPELLHWEFFVTHARSWRIRGKGGLCGRAGWMTTCEQCGQAVDFFVEQMS